MRTTPRVPLARAVVVAAAAVSLYACARKTLDADNAFVVLDFAPDVKTQRAQELGWKPAKASELMQPNDKLQTYAGAHATIGLKNDQQLFVHELTLLVFGDYDKDDAHARTTGTLVVESGRVQTRSLDAARRADMTWKTPNSEVKVGRVETQRAGYDLVIDAGADDKLSVLLGTAAVKAQGATVSVPEDFGTLVRHGQAPQPPRPLPPPPTGLRTDAPEYFRADLFTGLPLTWRASTAAASYRVVVAADDAFSRVALDAEAPAAAFDARALTAGAWRWRVSARDADGLESKPSATASFTVAKVFPDLAAPAPGAPPFLVRARDAGRRHYVGGWARRPDLGEHEIVVYSLLDRWRLQSYPYAADKPQPVVDADGYWEMRVNQGSRYRAYLTPKGAALPAGADWNDPPKVDGKTFLALAEADAP